MKNILLLTENREEFQDCIALFAQLGIQSFIYAGSNVQRTECIKLSESAGINCYFISQDRKGAISKVIFLISVIRKHQPDFIMVGAQIIYHRVALLLKPKKTKLIVYNRGLLCDIGSSPIWSFRLLEKMPKFLRELRFLNPFSADYSLVIGPANKAMLESYSVKNIYSVGLYYNKNFSDSSGTPSGWITRKKRILVVATQAYNTHGLAHMHENQINLIKKLACSPYFDDYQVIIKKHPRDEFCYEKHFQDLIISSENAKEFICTALQYYRQGFDIFLLSPPSTFLIEWVNSGLSAFIYRDQEVNFLYQNVLKSVKKKSPVNESLADALFEIGVDAFEVNGSVMSNLYSEEDVGKLRARLFE
ncbi:hypothetical protein [Marinobacter sp. ST-43]|uniref:hypothetical protein n=1 Tax=Marinobacter sp. ST-43 TaxID=3050453 RepID=UPI0026DF38FF|nr:hypothetical protein [Marinobacter sp. ST-43]